MVAYISYVLNICEYIYIHIEIMHIYIIHTLWCGGTLLKHLTYACVHTPWCRLVTHLIYVSIHVLYIGCKGSLHVSDESKYAYNIYIYIIYKQIHGIVMVACTSVRTNYTFTIYII